MSKSVKKISIILMALIAFIASVFAVNAMTTVRADVTGGTTDAIVMDTKAQVRLDDVDTLDKDETGMRFFINVDTAKVDSILESYQGYSVEYGVALLPAKFLDGGVLDVESTYVYNQKQREVLKIKLTNGTESDGVISYKAVLTDIPTLEYETDVAARAYIKLTKADSTVYLQSTNNVVKSIGEVATAYYNDPLSEEEGLKEYYEELLMQNMGTLSFDKQEYVLFKNSVNEKTITETVKVYGNKYGFELDVASTDQVQITFGTEGIADYVDGVLTPVARGTTTINVSAFGKTASATVKVETEEDLKLALGENEYASYDHKGYETLVEGVKGNLSEVSVGNYHGKEGVLKVSGTNEGQSLVKLHIPTAMTTFSPVTIQLYVEKGNTSGHGSVGISAEQDAVSWGEGYDWALASGRIVSGQWESIELSWVVYSNTISFIFSVDENNEFTYYISTIMAGTQSRVLTAADAPYVASKTQLDANEAASFDCDEYLNLVQHVGIFNNPVVEILDEYDGETGVLHIKGSSHAFSKMYIYLPKAIPAYSNNLTLKYQVSVKDPLYNSAWGLMTAEGAWYDDALAPHSTNGWSTYKQSNVAGQNFITIGINCPMEFDLYIASVTHDIDTASIRAENKEALTSALEEGQLANYNVDVYKYFAEVNSSVANFSAEIVDDATFGRKVLKITGTTSDSNGLIYLYLPKAISADGSFSFDYRFEATGTMPATNVFGIRDINKYWFTLKGPNELSGTYTISGAAGYANSDMIMIGVNFATTFSLYVSVVNG